MAIRIDEILLAAGIGVGAVIALTAFGDKDDGAPGGPPPPPGEEPIIQVAADPAIRISSDSGMALAIQPPVITVGSI